jgi:hypothetical protein
MNTLVKYLTSFRFLYIIIGGFLIYVLSASIDLIFIPTLEMSDGWCKDWTEKSMLYKKDKECAAFSDKIEERKYRHNKNMELRQSYKMFAILLLATVFTYFLIWLNPANFFDRKTQFEHTTGVMAVAVYYGIFTGLIMPIIYQELLPPPHQWFPQEFLEIRQARIEQILDNINEISEFMPGDEMAPE